MTRLYSPTMLLKTRLDSIAWWKILAAALLIGAGLRVGVAVMRPLALTYDEPTFVDLANNLVAGHGLVFSEDMYGVAIAGQATSFEEPVYPLWLAFLHLVAGTGDVRTLRVIQALASTLIVLLAYLLGRAVFSRDVGLVAAGLVAVWPSLIYFSAFLMQEALYILVLPLALLVTIVVGRSRLTIWKLFALGAVWGLTILVRGSTAIVVPLVLVWMLGASRTHNWMAAVRMVTVIVVGVLVVLMPWWVRNYRVQGAFVPLTTKAGYNLYHWDYPINNPDFESFGVPVPEVGGTEVQRDHTYQVMALSSMAQQPTTVLQDLAVKALKFFRPVIGSEGPGSLSLPYAVALALVYAGALLQLIGFGYRARKRNMLLLSLTIVLQVALAAVFFSNNRARLPVEPLLIVLASAFLVHMVWRRASA